MTTKSIKFPPGWKRKYKHGPFLIWDNRRPVNKQKPIRVKGPRTLWRVISRMVDKQGEVSVSIHQEEKPINREWARRKMKKKRHEILERIRKKKKEKKLTMTEYLQSK